MVCKDNTCSFPDRAIWNAKTYPLIYPGTRKTGVLPLCKGNEEHETVDTYPSSLVGLEILNGSPFIFLLALETCSLLNIKMGLELGSPSTNGRASIGRFTTKATPIRTKVSSLFFQRRFWICFLGCMMLAALLRQSYVSRERFFRTNDIVGIDGSDLDADGDAGTQGGLAGTTGLGTGEETGKMKRKRVKAVFNATLGFGEIFMPVMPQ